MKFVSRLMYVLGLVTMFGHAFIGRYELNKFFIPAGVVIAVTGLFLRDYKFTQEQDDILDSHMTENDD